LYNLRHAQLRNAIERIFGIIKRRFQILSHIPEYPFDTQVQLVFALTGLHNFIRLKSVDNELEYWKEVQEDVVGESEDRCEGEDCLGENVIGLKEDMEMSTFRDQLAQELWASYQCILQTRSQA